MVNPNGFWDVFDRLIFKPINVVSLAVSAVVLTTVGLVGIFYTAHFYLFGTVLIIGLSIAACFCLYAIGDALRRWLKSR